MLCPKLLVLFAIGSAVHCLVPNSTSVVGNDLARDARKKSGDTSDSDKDKEESLQLSGETSVSSESKEKRKKSTSLFEDRQSKRRICTPCEDLNKNRNDTSIQWICGGYQRARRTFKSLCMMHYRNCQDGTMFVKIHDFFCKQSRFAPPIGDHFFYDYNLKESDTASGSSASSNSSEKSSS